MFPVVITLYVVYTLRNKGTVRVQLSTLRYKFHKCASKGTNMYPAEYQKVPFQRKGVHNEICMVKGTYMYPLKRYIVI